MVYSIILDWCTSEDWGFTVLDEFGAPPGSEILEATVALAVWALVEMIGLAKLEVMVEMTGLAV